MRFLAAIALTVLTSCAWFADPANQEKVKATAIVVAERAFNIGVNVLLNAAANQNGDFNHSIATGLRSEIPNIVTSDDVSRVVKIWGPPAKQTATAASDLASAYAAANPQTPAARKAVVEAMASGLQDAATISSP